MRCRDCRVTLSDKRSKRCRRCFIRHKRSQRPRPRILLLRSITPNPNGCWDWKGRWHGRYGQLTYHGQRYTAHRFALLHFRPDYVRRECGEPEVPPDLHVMHTCDRGVCVNPWHLRIGTAQENVADMIAKGRAAWQKEDIEDLAAAMVASKRYATPYSQRR